jgi:hypothetical protein
LFFRRGFSASFVDDDPRQRVVVPALGLGFGEPARELDPGGVLAFEDEASAHMLGTSDVATVFRPMAGTPVDPVVPEGVT